MSFGPTNGGLHRRSIHFQDFEIKSQKNSLFGDMIGNRHMADINLTTGNSYLRYWSNHSKGERKTDF